MAKTTHRNTKIVMVSLPPGIHDRMKDVSHEKEITISELVRRAFEMYDLEYRKNKKHFETEHEAQPSKRELARKEKEEFTERVKAMGDEELTTLLIEANVILPKYEHKEIAGSWVETKVHNGDLYQFTTNEWNKDQPPHTRLVWTRDEIFEELRKLKKIL